MISRIFNNKFIIAQFGIIIVFFALMINREIMIVPPQGFGPLYNSVFQILNGNTLAIYITFFSIVVLQGLGLQLILSFYGLIPRNNFIVLLIWPILLFSNNVLATVNPVLIASLISTWALFRLLSTGERENPLPSLFSASFLFSTASLFYGNILWFVVFLIIALLLLSIFRGHELFVSLIAFALPYLFLWAYSFVFDKNLIFWTPIHVNISDWHFFEDSRQLWVSIGISVLIMLFSIYAVSQTMLQLFSKLIQVRKITSVIFSLLLLSFALQFLSGHWWYVHPTIIFIPLSLLLSIFLSEQKKSIYIDSILITIILLEISQQYLI